ncbi:hypothetical protein [Sulfurimonas paralvinellae]|uniref:Uncharacterized protein n=1 Tax=Sulfurimonas paralvinellae TaxID=317658 RepID=A0A7M1B8K8_9BACT|nr:hypothetical protein [Sulfurimonas paralvinellae]QOP46025.1 hypothetical protein FM071_06830 [Sulfurimonas paralvinellae]
MKIGLSIVIIILAVLSTLWQLDAEAMTMLDASFDRAMVAFGLAKALNAVISLIQGTELSLTPVGIGLNFSVGEVLDPFNDIVERFSWVMLLSSVALGIEKLLLIFSSKLFLQIALSLSGVLTLSFLWIKKLKNSLFLAYSLKIFLFLLVIRFAAVVFVYSSQILYDSLLQNEYVHATKVITKTKTELEAIETKNKSILQQKKEQGFLDSLGSKYDSVVESLNLSKQLDSLEKSIDDATRNIISLITVFVVQTVLFPLLFLWFIIAVIRWIFGYENDKLIKYIIY